MFFLISVVYYANLIFPCPLEKKVKRGIKMSIYIEKFEQIDNVKAPVMPMKKGLLVCYVPYSINGVWSRHYCHDILQASEFFAAVRKNIAKRTSQKSL